MKNRHLHCWPLKHLQVISNFPLYNIKHARSSQGLLLIIFKIWLSSCIKSHGSGKKKSAHKCFKLQLDILKLAAKELQSKAVTMFKPPTQIRWCMSIGGILYDNCPQLSAPNLVAWFNLNSFNLAMEHVMLLSSDNSPTQTNGIPHKAQQIRKV